MKIIKSRIFAFVLGAVIFSGITGVTAYTILASDVGFTPKNNSWKVDNVSDAINDLYSKSKPAYTGTTSITPTTSTQTLSTKDKLLKDNITIDPIPSSYKNLTTTTDVNPSNLLNGIKAYNSSGELVTGNVSTNCASGSFICTTCTNSSGQKLLNFIPKYFMIYYNEGTTWFMYYYNKEINSNEFQVSSDGTSFNYISFSSRFKTDSNNNLFIHSINSYYTNKSLYYMACK